MWLGLSAEETGDGKRLREEEGREREEGSTNAQGCVMAEDKECLVAAGSCEETRRQATSTLYQYKYKHDQIPAKTPLSGSNSLERSVRWLSPV